MMRATYCPESNKLRLYSTVRLDDETWAKVKAAGFKWAPKQAENAGYACLVVAPMWTPSREDLLLELCGEIEDEDYSPEERSADRAERFEGYREKRTAEAMEAADDFEAQPTAFGHQNRDRAERQAKRADRKRLYANSQWSKAEYWQERTRAVIRHAIYKSSPAVRRDRILRLEREQRKQQKTLDEYAKRFKMWQKVLTLAGADRVVDRSPSGYGILNTTSDAGKLAYALACDGRHEWTDYTHPRTGKDLSADRLLTDDIDPCTPAEVATLWLEQATDPSSPDSWAARWANHFALRLAYENQMIGEEGGKASEADMVPGGFIKGGRSRFCGEGTRDGWLQIQQVTKSPVTKRVVSVKVWGTDSGYTAENTRETKPKLVTVKIERLGADCYRAPTPEELAEFNTKTKEAKSEAKAKKPKPVALINPIDEDAERLQALWNQRALDNQYEGRIYSLTRDGMTRDQAVKFIERNQSLYPEKAAQEVRRMTQAQYSESSKGSYSRLETVEVCEHGHRPKTQYGRNVDPSPIAFKVRKSYGSGNDYGMADRVVVITDKPQKPLPLDWSKIENSEPELTAPGGDPVAGGTLYPGVAAAAR